MFVLYLNATHYSLTFVCYAHALYFIPVAIVLLSHIIWHDARLKGKSFKPGEFLKMLATIKLFFNLFLTSKPFRGVTIHPSVLNRTVHL